MFQNYMRSRLGIGGTMSNPNQGATLPAESPINQVTPFVNHQAPGGATDNPVPAGMNAAPYHPNFNQNGWPGHPMNNGGATIPAPTPIQAPGASLPAPTPVQAPPSTVGGTRASFNPYAW